jgi:imidazolonepropionase
MEIVNSNLIFFIITTLVLSTKAAFPMKILIKNIAGLIQTSSVAGSYVAGNDMSRITLIKDSYLVIDEGNINDLGDMGSLPEDIMADRILDASGRFVFPSFCDSHTHIVYAGSREAEFSDKIKGLSYEEIARRGGGILNSAKRLHDTSDEELYTQSMVRINEIIRQGTGAVEIKSGYGLNTPDELRMLRVIRRIRETSPLEVRATFLGEKNILKLS